MLKKYGRWKLLGDLSVYKNKEGEVIPEIQDMLVAIMGYYHERAKSGTVSNSPYDIG